MKILLVHDWGQAAKQYLFLTKEPRYHISLYEFPGFGACPVKYTNKILYGFAVDLRECLCEHRFDMIVACGMGCNVLMRAVQGLQRPSKLVLVNPTLGGVPKLRAKLLAVSLLQLRSVRRDLDRKYDLSTENSNVEVLINSLHELAFDTWKQVMLPKGTKVYRGECDEFIDRLSVGDEVIPGMGHSALQYIRDIIMKEVFLWECSTDYQQS